MSEDVLGAGMPCLGCGLPINRDFRHTFCRACDPSITLDPGALA